MYGNNGTLTGTAPNLTYVPNANWNGEDSFAYQTFDGTDLSAVATVFITVNPVNDPPTAMDQSVNVVEDVAKLISLDGSDPETPLATLAATDGHFQIVAQPAHGSLLPSDIANVFTYTPDNHYYGTTVSLGVKRMASCFPISPLLT